MHVKSQNKISAPDDYKSKKQFQQLFTTFVQLTWLECVTKSHWVCPSTTQYKFTIPDKVGGNSFKILKSQNINSFDICKE